MFINRLSDHGIEVILAVILLLSGGFYDYSAMVLGALLSAMAFCALCGKTQIRHYISMPIIFILWQIPVSIWAIDRYQALAGFLRLSPLIIWIWLCAQSEIIDRDRVMNFIPYSGAVMTILGVASYITGIFKDRMWMADRFGGTFQYANTCALYLLMGIILISSAILEGGRGIVMKAVLGVLIVGLLLTGCRSVLILAVAWGIYKSVREKAMRLTFAIIVVTSAALGGLYVYITGNMQNIGRIFTSLSHGSTFFGRLLYMKDGLKIIAKYPQGLGHEGYYYVQPLYQNGVYEVRFVHNDYLQAALDVGLIPAILLIGWLILMIVKGRAVRKYRELLAVILASVLFDLHMQYILIPMIAILCFDISGDLAKGTGTSAGKRKATDRKDKPDKLIGLLTGHSFGKYANIQRTESKVIYGLVFAAYIVATIPFAAYRLEDYDLMLKFFPHDTEAEIRILSATENVDRARSTAIDVINHNRYITSAYRNLAFMAVMDNDPEAVLNNMDEVVKINRYGLKDYQLYDTILDSVQTGILRGQTPLDEEKSAELLERIERTKEELPKRLEALKETTDPLAYKLRDVPVFSW